MTDISAALRGATAQLSASTDTPRLDAELLMAHALGVSRSALLLDPKRFAVPDSFAALVDRRAACEPVAYITGSAEFWSLTFAVGSGVLIPRGDSETLIDAACAHFQDRSAALRILDLGTGPGALLLAALSEYPNAQGLGVDASDTALGYASANADALGLSTRARFVHGDWTADIDGPFDLILCNPPYIAVDETLMPDVADHEPAGALFAGADGLDDYRRIVPELPRVMAPGGAAVVEIGWTQAAAVSALAAAAGMRGHLHRDLAGRDRALLLTHPAGHKCNQ